MQGFPRGFNLQGFFPDIDRKLVQGFILQGSFVDTGLKGFFLQSARLFLAMERFFLAIWCGLLLARKGGSAVRGGSESGGMKGGRRGWARKPSLRGVAPQKWYESSLWHLPKFHSDFFRQTWPSFLGPNWEIPTDKAPCFKGKLPKLRQTC